MVKAQMDTVYYDNLPADEGEECEVRMDNNKIVVSYKDAGSFVIYKGKDEGNGHFVLKCAEKQGKATLHQIPKGKVLEGFWIEEGHKGFWRIILP